MLTRGLEDLALELVNEGIGLSDARRLFEKAYVRMVLEHTSSKFDAAQKADMDTANFRRKLKQLDMWEPHWP